MILGSRSPRRRELLGLIVDSGLIECRPPISAEELGFDGLKSWIDIAHHLQLIARAKNVDVSQQLTAAAGLSHPERESRSSRCLVLTADTVIVATDSTGALHVLGQPPLGADWANTVRQWFRDFYAGRPHIAATAVCISEWPNGRCEERIAQSHVWMRPDVEPLLDWYLATGEPLEKAGGYALQGLASVFVTRVEGSISNVIGLPLETLVEMLPRLGWPLGKS